MTKPPKFLICENPMVVDSGTFILHTRSPQILAQAIHFDTEDERMEAEKQVTIGSHTTLAPDEHVLLAAIWLAPDDALVQGDPQKQADTLAKIMSRMADWYHAYCIWEDAQAEESID